MKGDIVHHTQVPHEAARRSPCGESSAFLRPLGRQGAFSCCHACGLLARTPLPPVEEIACLYADRCWSLYQAEQVSSARDSLHAHVLELLDGLHPQKGTLVDVGCGGGRFLAAGQKDGWRGIGYDPSVAAVAHAKSMGVDALVRAWPPSPLGDDTADAVTFINVLDHLRDPFSALEEACRVLRPGGALYVRVLNGPLHAWLTALPAYLKLSRLAVLHLYGFGRRALHHHLSRLGFEGMTVRTSPPSERDSYAREGEPDLLRLLLKRADREIYRFFAHRWLKERAWGPSIEVTATKMHRRTTA